MKLVCITFVAFAIVLETMAVVEPTKVLPPAPTKTTPTAPLSLTPQKFTPSTVSSTPTDPKTVPVPTKVSIETPKTTPALPTSLDEKDNVISSDTMSSPWTTPPTTTNWLTLQSQPTSSVWTTFSKTQMTTSAWQTNALPPTQLWSISPPSISVWDSKPTTKPTLWK